MMMPQTRIAIVSLSCRFPDAESPTALWQNAMEGRRSFRSIPRERLNLEQYAESLLGEADSIAPVMAGLLTGWEFDRARFRVPAPTFQATDMAHWLALELAADAISRAGLDRLDRSRTAVIVANTLTGEFSRAAMLRHRLPFLDTMLANAVETEGIESTVGARLRQAFGREIRRKFPAPNEDSLAGGLANTIAGRIANHFDLRGGAYTVDGACASSLVAVADAANLLASHQADAVVVGGVDLSIDPFELVGFSRNGALAIGDMRVFDVSSRGFWPGEGGAFAVIVRDCDAGRAGLDRLAVLRGWGMSTDGAGGLTRPSSTGQLLAYRRAYEGADADPADLAFVEAHGTGTAVGDPTEIQALASLRGATSNPLLIGSIKANIGHTKAAAGFAGLAKAIEALRQGVLPPHVGCRDPHPAFAETENRIQPSLIPKRIDGTLAGVSSFGFGGINAHIVIEQVGKPRRTSVSLRAPAAFDAELFLFSGTQRDEVARDLEVLLARASSISTSELSEAAAAVCRRQSGGSVNVGIVASDAGELIDRLSHARSALENGRPVFWREQGVFVGDGSAPPRIGYIFPGQGAPSHMDGGLWAPCFGAADEFRRLLPKDQQHKSIATEVAQPTIVAASMAGLAVLDSIGINAETAIGHSLGEISALSWGGAITRNDAIALSAMRGTIMARYAVPGGCMLRVALSSREAEAIAAPVGDVAVACENGRAETVLSGPSRSIERLVLLLDHASIDYTRLATSHAFHSADIARAVDPFRQALESVALGQCHKLVLSTVTGAPIDETVDLRTLLTSQLVGRVRFETALVNARQHADIFVEVGPGHGLARLAELSGVPTLPIDAFGASVAPLLLTLGELHAKGHHIDATPLFAERTIRRFDASIPSFLTSPCGSRDTGRTQAPSLPPVASKASNHVADDAPSTVIAETVIADSLGAILSLISAQTGLPHESIGPDDRFLDSLHLNSLSVSRIVIAAARAVGARSPRAPTEFANATPRILASALDELREFSQAKGDLDRIAGVRPWVDTYSMRWADVMPSSLISEAVMWSTVAVSEEQDLSALPDTRDGWLLRLHGSFSRATAESLIAIAAEAARRGVRNLGIVHSAAPISAFARSLALENAFQTVRVLGVVEGDGDDQSFENALQARSGRYTEFRFDKEGSLKSPVFVPVSSSSDASGLAIGAGDVVVVIGGGRGITAECALELGRKGAALILVGRSPAESKDVSDTLERASKLEVRCAYVCADACDAAQLEARLVPAICAIGKPTVLIHAAAVNEPMQIAKVNALTARRCLATKLDAFTNAISSCGPSLRKVLTFGSLIGRIGLEGEAHYALANEALSDAAVTWASAAPGRSALALEWSIWGGIGMGERLGTIERLVAQGVDPISVDDALAKFDQLVQAGAEGTIAVTSRFGQPRDLDLGRADLPSLRFVDRPLLYYPNKEIILETDISRGRDRYIDDHVIAGQAILPGVIALEAMAQAASCLCNGDVITSIESASFERAVQLDMRQTPLRLAALRREGRIEVALSAGADDFSAPAARAVFRHLSRRPDSATASPRRDLDGQGFDAKSLYGQLFFNRGRFQRINRFFSLSSRHVVATLLPDVGGGWFGSYEAKGLVLADPGAADACLHALQVTIPHKRVVPVSVERVDLMNGGPPALVRAVEREVRSGYYIFDIDVEDSEGRCVQRWSRAAFRSIGKVDIASTLKSEFWLKAPFVERSAREAFDDDSIKVAIINDDLNTREKRRVSAFAVLGITDSIDRRSDGRPILRNGEGFITLAHREGMTLALSADNHIGCDLETGDASGAQYRFAAIEACRKVGRQATIRPTEELRRGEPFQVDGVDLLLVDLPDQESGKTIALSSIRGFKA
ncbi:type I polyketide synthase [Mesorhizobium sp. ES1-6]|uniref:type I polyketide synthase n=1 Tax=Mesorhizobium sp. ES1-6 TaxID=2876626 RepID=UPI001CCFC264|nr:type I polyketide synthase [Mesorhizobium sp. ES1-6]MBZ9803452.1 SDR family NAD(P)-dependent oxidoreductase [Mesorhizobium sp. ES1-6]